jgi:Acyl-CoA dehydrogenase, C-terminal domain
MDVRLSAEQQALRESAVRLVDRLGPKAVGELGDPERVAKLDAAITASGWRDLRSAADEGLPLASGLEVGIVAEELGRGLADVSFLGPILAAELRRMAGAPPSLDIETVVLTDDLAGVARTVDGALVSGVAIDCQGASRALVVDGGRDGDGLASVELDGALIGPDLTRPSATIERPSLATPLGTVRPITAEDLTRWTALGLAVACADLVGVMTGAVELATAYAVERQQYGASIGSFQSVQHLLADAFVLSEGARSATLHAAWAVDVLDPTDALDAAAVAKAYAARAARTVCETAVQVHGGIGNTWECLAHVYLRRGLLSSHLLGDVGASLTRVLEHRGIGGPDGLS